MLPPGGLPRGLEDQTERYAGAQAGAPAEVFAAMLGLAELVLDPTRYEALCHRLGV